MLLSSLGINIVYQAGVKNFDMADLDATVDAYRGPHFAIVFHGGGNFGDLYHTEHNLKLNVMRAYPQIRTHIFPQSLKFRSDETTAATKQVLDQLEHATIAVRDQQSLEFANKHFAHSGFKVTMTPDIVFYMGYRPELREVFGKSTSDLLLFRRADGERTEWDWAGGAGRPGFPDNFVKTLSEEGEKSLSFRIGDWSGDFDLTEEELSEVDGSTMHYRAWKRSMQGFEWLAESEFIILDRLHGEFSLCSSSRVSPLRLVRLLTSHLFCSFSFSISLVPHVAGHIFSLVLGIPHILIDNKIGKLYDYYTTWVRFPSLCYLIQPPSFPPLTPRFAHRQRIAHSVLSSTLILPPNPSVALTRSGSVKERSRVLVSRIRACLRWLGRREARRA